MDSTDGVHMIHGYRWYDTEKKRRGVIQLVHGMLEYVERYDTFAKYLASLGYFVVGHDHLGHGDSVNSPKELGRVGKDGAAVWLKDMETVRRMAVTYAPGTPYILIGHSMGSYLVRRYLIYNGRRVDAAIIMGTGQQSPLLIQAALAITGLGMIRGGGYGYSRLLNNLTCSGYARRFPDNARMGSWLSRDPKVMDAILRDPKMNFQFTRNAYRALFQTIQEAIDPKRAARMPKELPLLVLSGDEDPVGYSGKGVRRFEKMLKKIGMKDVTCILYPGSRHELINELDHEQVFDDIQNWCDQIRKQIRRDQS